MKFIKMLFYAANTIFDDRTNMRMSESIEKEILMNENALCKIFIKMFKRVKQFIENIR